MTERLHMALTDKIIASPQNRTSRSTVDVQSVIRCSSWCTPTRAAGINLSVFPAGGIHYMPNSQSEDDLTAGEMCCRISRSLFAHHTYTRL